MENMYLWKMIFKYMMILKILIINININGNIVFCIVKVLLNINMRDMFREWMLLDYKLVVFYYFCLIRFVYGIYFGKKI